MLSTEIEKCNSIKEFFCSAVRYKVAMKILKESVGDIELLGQDAIHLYPYSFFNENQPTPQLLRDRWRCKTIAAFTTLIRLYNSNMTILLNDIKAIHEHFNSKVENVIDLFHRICTHNEVETLLKYCETIYKEFTLKLSSNKCESPRPQS